MPTDVTAPFQLSLQGLLHGPGQTWQVAEVDGLDTPPLRVDDQVRPGRDGADSGDDLYGPRTVIATLQTSSDVQADIDQAIIDLKAAWARTQLVVPLDVWVEGGPRRVWGKPRGARFTYQSDGTVRARCEMFCGDYRMYSTDLRVLALPEQDNSGGVTWPITWPAAWGASSTGIVDADNDGTHPAPVIWTIPGPKVNPQLEEVTTGVILQLIGTIADGSTVVVDTAAETIELDGVDRSSWRTGDSGWPAIPADGGQLRETSTSGTGTSSAAWRDTWV